MADTLSYIAGHVGQDPKTKPTRKGDIIVFTVAVDRSWSRDVQPQWYDVSVWNEKLQEAVKANVRKGTKVCVVGPESTHEYQNKTYPSIIAGRVYLCTPVDLSGPQTKADDGVPF